MGKSGKNPGFGDDAGLGGFLGGLGTLIDKLSELAEKGKELKEMEQFGGQDGKVQGVYGFSIKTNIGRDREGGGGQVKVEPFGNVRRDDQTGRATVHEISEPLVDLFEEPDHLLIVAEMPGVGAEDVRLELADDILTIVAEKGAKKYRKEVLLPAACTTDRMSHTCRNGVLEVKLGR